MGWEGMPPRTLIPPPSPKKPVSVASLQAREWPKVKKEKKGGCLRAHRKKGEGRGTPCVMGKSWNGSQSWNLTLQPLRLFIVKTLIFYHGHLIPIYNSKPSTHSLIASSLWVWGGGDVCPFPKGFENIPHPPCGTCSSSLPHPPITGGVTV